jgi:hypothetical protein
MSKSNSDELDRILWGLTDQSAWDLSGITQKQSDDLSETLSADRIEARSLIQSEISKREQLLLDELEATYRGQIIPVDNKDMVKLADVQSIYRGIKDFINAKRGKK